MQSIRPIMSTSSHPFRARGVDPLCPLLFATSAGVLVAGGHLINQLSAWTHPILISTPCFDVSAVFLAARSLGCRSWGGGAQEVSPAAKDAVMVLSITISLHTLSAIACSQPAPCRKRKVKVIDIFFSSYERVLLPLSQPRSFPRRRNAGARVRPLQALTIVLTFCS